MCMQEGFTRRPCRCTSNYARFGDAHQHHKPFFLHLFPCCGQGMAVKYLGSSCQPEVCDADCPGQHQFYRACVLPPRALPEPQPGSSNASSDGSSAADLAASLAQAHAASSGRATLLILDLHKRLRSHSLEKLLQIETPEQLQVGGWMPL